MKPFLKWAGSKYQIIDHIKAILPQGNRLIEPFVGTGSVFLNTNYKHYLLGEINFDLINLYQQVQNKKQRFINYAKKFFVDENLDKEKYLLLRKEFNVTDDLQLKAALFIYLNRFGYNGLCRYNSKGGFNVPFGDVKKKNYPEQALINFSQKCNSSSVIFQEADFVETLQRAKKGDVIYCDPPYVPLSETAKFTAYSQAKFGEEQQLKLAHMAKQLAKKGIPVIISNHDTPFVRQAYKGAKLHYLQVQRHISRNAYKRHKAPEVLAVF